MQRLVSCLHIQRGRCSANLFALACLGGILTVSAPASAQITLPPGNAPFLSLFGEGVQFYRSSVDTVHPGAFVWQFVAPQADLYTDATKSVHFGTHFAGPTWKADGDSSEVTGTVIARGPSPHPDSIQELLLAANPPTGGGIFGDVSYILRLDTVGGLAPSTLPTEIGEEFRSPYTATYRFLEAVPEPGLMTWCLCASVAGSLLFRRKRAHSVRQKFSNGGNRNA